MYRSTIWYQLVLIYKYIAVPVQLQHQLQRRFLSIFDLAGLSVDFKNLINCERSAYYVGIRYMPFSSDG